MAGDSIRLAMRLRASGIDTEVYPEPAKMAKQVRYADQIGIPYAIVLGPDEKAGGVVALKELATGEQVVATIDEAAERMR